MKKGLKNLTKDFTTFCKEHGITEKKVGLLMGLVTKNLNIVIDQENKPSNLNADIRNKLTPVDNLIAMLEDGIILNINDLGVSNMLEREVIQVKKSIEYLSNLETQH